MLSGGVKLEAPAAAPKALNVVEAEAQGTLSASYVKFDREKHFTTGDGDPMEKYSRRRFESKNAVQWGQLKLLVEEIQFLTLYWDPESVPEPTVVYVGSAPGTHIVMLASMFPQVKWELHDPREHDKALKENKQVKIHEGFFTDDVAKTYAERKDVFLIVDIRSLTYDRSDTVSGDQAKVNEEIVARNMEQQMKWTQIIKPVRASLKFRLPYSWDFEVKKGPTRLYLDGLLFKQPWAPCTSTEGRLVPHQDLRLREWTYQTYEEMMYYHNKNVRVGTRFLNPLTEDRTAIDPDVGLLNDWDSAATAVIAMEYMDKFLGEYTADDVRAVLREMVTKVTGGAQTLLGFRVGSKGYCKADDED